jgi:hypothetical protein
MLQTDIFEVLNEVDPNRAISVLQHDYTPSDTVKYLNKVQYAFPRKNCRLLLCGIVRMTKIVNLHQPS